MAPKVIVLAQGEKAYADLTAEMAAHLTRMAKLDREATVKKGEPFGREVRELAAARGLTYAEAIVSLYLVIASMFDDSIKAREATDAGTVN